MRKEMTVEFKAQTTTMPQTTIEEVKEVEMATIKAMVETTTTTTTTTPFNKETKTMEMKLMNKDNNRTTMMEVIKSTIPSSRLLVPMNLKNNFAMAKKNISAIGHQHLE